MTDSSRSPHLEIAVKAAQAAGELLKSNFGAVQIIYHKGATDLVTEMDRQAEKLIINMLQEAFPSYEVLGEEGGEQAAQLATDGETARWIIDPLDGTTNYAHGYPLFAVCIGLEQAGQVTSGVVYNPILDELFVAERGQGATLNGQPIQVSQTATLAESVLASGFSYDAWTNPDNNGAEWCRFLKRVTTLRCDGSAALDLCHVAMGRLDGFWEIGLEPWDMAAASLIVEEAGGVLSQTNGASFDLYIKSVVATNPKLYPQMLAVLADKD